MFRLLQIFTEHRVEASKNIPMLCFLFNVKAKINITNKIKMFSHFAPPPTPEKEEHENNFVSVNISAVYFGSASSM